MKRRTNIPHEPIINHTPSEPLIEEKIEWTFFIKDAKHSVGSNHYEFQFPPQWRTLENCELSIGVRAIYLRKCTRKVYIGQTFIMTRKRKKEWTEHCHKYDLYPFILQTEDTMQNVADKLNVDIERTYKGYNSWKAGKIYGVPLYRDIFRWEINDHKIYINDHAFHVPEEIESGEHEQTVELRYLSQKACEDFRQIMCLKPDEYMLSMPIERTIWNRKDDILIKASFVNQSNHHLGHTNSQFIPMKIYPITNKDVNFWIETYNLSDTDIVELPPDGKDSLVLECVLFIKHK